MFKLYNPKRPAQQDWHSAYIVYQLRLKGLSFRKLSRLNGYCHSAAAQVVHMPWPKMERLVADALGVPPQTIWPSRYDEHGNTTRRPRGRVPSDTNGSTRKQEGVIQRTQGKST